MATREEVFESASLYSLKDLDSPELIIQRETAVVSERDNASSNKLDFEDDDFFTQPDVEIGGKINHNANTAETIEGEVGELNLDDQVEDEEEELHIIGNNSKQSLDATRQQGEEEEENGQTYSEDENYEDEDGEDNEAGKKAFSYQHEVAKPKYTVGGKKLSISEAQLYGLLDEKGNLQLRSTSPKRDHKQMMTQVQKLSQPRSPSDTEWGKDDEGDLTFHPKRSAEALAAMKNKRCGYDFMDRLNNRGEFLDRIGPDLSKKKKLPKSELDALQQNYDAKIDKLQCPQCLRPQSFDEFFENKRNCTMCKIKFEKLHVTSGVHFLKKMQTREAEKAEKLKEVEKEMYGNLGKLVFPSNIGGSSSSSSKQGKGSHNQSSLPSIVSSNKSSVMPQTVPLPPPGHGDERLPAPDKRTNAKGVVGIDLAAKGAEKIRSIQQKKENEMNQAFKNIQRGANEHHKTTDSKSIGAKIQKLVQI